MPANSLPPSYSPLEVNTRNAILFSHILADEFFPGIAVLIYANFLASYSNQDNSLCIVISYENFAGSIEFLSTMPYQNKVNVRFIKLSFIIEDYFKRNKSTKKWFLRIYLILSSCNSIGYRDSIKCLIT